jgi:hypothetical protein
MLGPLSIVLTADTYTSVLPELAHHAAEATARLILTSAATTSRTIRNGHHTNHKRPATRSSRRTIPPSDPHGHVPSNADDAPAESEQVSISTRTGADWPGAASRDVSVGDSVSWPHIGPTQDHPRRVKI